MAIERGVDDIDIADLQIENNSKEIEINLDSDFDDIGGIDDIFGDMDDDQNEILADGTMLVGVPPEPMMDQGGDFFENLAKLNFRLFLLYFTRQIEVWVSPDGG